MINFVLPYLESHSIQQHLHEFSLYMLLEFHTNSMYITF